MEKFFAGYSHPSSLLPDDNISDISNIDNSHNNDNNNNNNENKGVTKSLLTELFFQNVLGFRGTVVSWQTFEVSELQCVKIPESQFSNSLLNLKFKSLKA